MTLCAACMSLYFTAMHNSDAINVDTNFILLFVNEVPFKIFYLVLLFMGDAL